MLEDDQESALEDDAFFISVKQLLESPESKDLHDDLEQLLEVLDYYQLCKEDNWKSYEGSGIVPYCFWKDSEHEEIPFTAGLIDGAYQEFEGLKKLPEILDNVGEAITKLSYAYITTYIKCRDSQYEMTIDRYERLLEELKLSESRSTYWERIKHSYYKYVEQNAKEKVAAYVLNCTEQEEIVNEVKELIELIDSEEEIRGYYNIIAAKIGEYLKELEANNNLGYYRRGKLVFQVASLFIPATELAKLPKAKKVLKGLSEAKDGVWDDVLQRLANTGGKVNLLTKLDNLTSLKTWVNGLDDVADANLITKLDGLDVTDLAKLETDIASNSMGAGLKALLKESPDDLNDIWKLLKDDPKYAFELSSTGGPRWEKWAQGNFFKTVTKAGKDFEELICKVVFKNRSSAKYLELKNKFQTNFSKNLDDYEMFSQVQLKYNSTGDYFVADQIFVKYDAFGEIDDLIVLENKLSSTTAFSPNQTSALQSNSFTVRSNPIESGTSNGLFLNKDEVLSFSETKQWYKVHSSGDGTAITGIQKVN